MVGHHEIKWHIDTDTSVACRAQICLGVNDRVFQFKDSTGIHELKMRPGELCFINTGWNHRVISGTTLRRQAILSFHFDYIIEKTILYK